MKDEVFKTISNTFEVAAEGVQKIERQIDKSAQPIRQSVFSRFPILFTLATTFGVAATFFGFERMLQEISFLNNRPWLILLLGILVLSVTGTLYKVLSANKDL
jgi:protein-S-isoprenylcysteine O-methyltransferase Ste14